MKKVALFALLLAAAAATAAQAAIDHEPLWNATYVCNYDNYFGNATDGGLSVWHSRVPYNPGDNLLLRAKETFTTRYGNDTYNVTWAKPKTPWPPANNSTTWEFTFAGGPQCKKTKVSPDSTFIIFQECTDGHTRTCDLY